jgi:Nucleotidyltransferase of unknown function (DUF6036)
MIFYSDFKELLILLNKYKVKYIIIGGYAISVYSHPKNTDDIDIWIEAKTENAAKILKALDEFGFGNLNITIEDLVKEDFVIQLGYPPIRIDILTSVSALTFDEAFNNREIQDLTDIGKVSFISYEDLIKNKKSSNRLKDKQALEWLKEYGKGRT